MTLHLTDHTTHLLKDHPIDEKQNKQKKELINLGARRERRL